MGFTIDAHSAMRLVGVHPDLVRVVKDCAANGVMTEFARSWAPIPKVPIAISNLNRPYQPTLGPSSASGCMICRLASQLKVFLIAQKRLS